MASLTWLTFRRGRVGRKTRVFVRSLWVVVLGVGGWLGGVLVALVWLPTVPLTSDLLVTLSAGLPVGLGVYGAWLRSGSPWRTGWAGLVAAVAGALVGARLGFGVMAAPFAVLTATFGAAAAANLALIGFDMLRARSPREPSGATSAAAVRAHA